jgi:hypothetical protein
MIYGPNGSINITIVDGTTFTGLYAPDGSINVVEAPGGSHTGAYHPCGALYVEITDSPVQASYAPTGAIYVSTSPQGAARLVTIVAGGFPDWALADAALDLDFQRNRYYSGGVNEAFGDIFTFARNSVGMAQNLDGSWTTFQANEPRITDRGILVELIRTNLIANNTMQGAVIGVLGSGGALPTGWSFGGSTTSVEVIGVGVAGGIDYIDLRFFGTAVNTNPVILGPEPAAVGSIGQTYAQSVFIQHLAGDMAANVNIPGGAFVLRTGGEGGATTITTLPTTLTRYTQVRTLTATAAEQIIRWAYTNVGQAFDFTLRIGMPQRELGAFVSSPIPTTNGAITRASDALTANFPDIGASLTAFSQFEAPDVLPAGGWEILQFGNDGGNVDFRSSSANGSQAVSQVRVGASTHQNTSQVNAFVPNGLYNGLVKIGPDQHRHCINGAAVATSVFQNAPTGYTYVAVGDSSGIGAQILPSVIAKSYIKRITAFPTVVLDAEAQSMTAMPSAFSFTDVTNATTSTLYTSNAITVAGLYDKVEVPASVAGGEMSINGGAWRTTPALVKNGDTISVRRTSSAADATAVTVVLTVGNTTDTYSITTATAYEAEANTLFAFVDTNGGTWDNTKKGHVNTLIAALKTASVWSKFDRLGVYTESVSDVALLDWKDPTATYNDATGCFFSATGGMTTDGMVTSGLQLDYNPTTAGGNFTQNSASMGIWLKTAASTTGPGIGGGTAWANIEDASNRIGFRMNDGTTSVSATNSNTDGTGFFVLVRPDASNKYSYKNGNTTPVGSHAVASTALANSLMHVGTNNLSTPPYSSQILMSFFGGALTSGEQQSFYNALNTYFTAIGAL